MKDTNQTFSIDTITQSALATYLSCRQKFVLHYIFRLNKKGIAPQFLVGTAVHNALEHILNPNQDSSIESAIRIVHDTFDQEIESSTHAIISTDKLDQARAQAETLVRMWCVFEYPTFQQTYRVIATEVSIERTYDNHLPLFLNRMAGKVDAIVKDKHGRVWIMEHKTRSTLSTLDTTGLDLDFQALYYILLCQKIKNLPSRPIGFLYNAMQKPKHRISNKGYDELCNRMQEAITKDPSKYFDFSTTLIEESLLIRAERNLKMIIAELDNLSTGNAYMNMKACNDYQGCQFRPLCQIGISAQQPDKILTNPLVNHYEQRPQIHPEL